MHDFWYLLGDFEAINRGQTGEDELLRTKASFGRRTKERLTNSRKSAVESSKTYRPVADARKLREPLDTLDMHRHHFALSVKSMKDTMDHGNFEFSAFASMYYCLTN